MKNNKIRVFILGWFAIIHIVLTMYGSNPQPFDGNPMPPCPPPGPCKPQPTAMP